MTRTAVRPHHRHGGQRVLACILLLLVTYNVTAELAHSHARPLSPRPAVGATFDSAPPAGQTVKPLAPGECLLCQFQQQLAHGLVNAPPFTLRPQTTAAAVAAQLSHYIPTTDAPACGRAPPNALFR